LRRFPPVCLSRQAQGPRGPPLAVRLAAFLLALLAAGCVEADLPPPPPQAEQPAPAELWHFMATFTRDYVDGDIDAVCAITTPDAPCEILQSEPPTYGGVGRTLAECEDVQARVLALPRTVLLDACLRVS
jgi:hypothetical protein